MRVKQVTVARLKSLPNYENERIEVTVELDAGESPAKAVLEARKFILEQFKLNAPKAKAT